MKKLISIKILVCFIFMEGQALVSAEAVANSTSAPLKMEVIGGPSEPVIKPGDPGTEGIKMGFEGGTVIKQEGVYHLFTSEGIREVYYTRLGYWQSVDGVQWKRIATLFESEDDFTGKSLRASLWSPMPVYNEEEQLWNLFYVAYRSKPNDAEGWNLNYDGRIVRAVSQVKGRAGIGGPYKDVEVILKPDEESQPWEGLQGVDSFFPYRAEGKWYGFYGSAQTQAKKNTNYSGWNIGLAEAPKLKGPWSRCKKGNPVKMGRDFAENPVISQLENDLYVAMMDGGAAGFGYSFSKEGRQWSQFFPLSLTPMIKPWWRFMRTPLSLIKEQDGSYTVFYTAFMKDSPFGGLGKVSVRLLSSSNEK